MMHLQSFHFVCKYYLTLTVLLQLPTSLLGKFLNSSSLHRVLSFVCSSLTSMTGRLGSGFSGGGYGGGARHSPLIIDADDSLFAALGGAPMPTSTGSRRSVMSCMLLIPTLSRLVVRSSEPSE